MAHPVGGYRIDGKRVPGVTTILSRFKESGALIHWAWNEGVEGRDYRTTRDSAADAGTCCHAMIEADWHGKEFDRSDYKPDILEKADHAFLAYLEWKEQVNLEVVGAEEQMLSRKYLFGGTPDAVMVAGKLLMGDYKTSNGVYADHLIQVGGGYSLLYEETYPDKPLEGVVIVRFSKPKEADDPISFHHHHYSAEIIPILQKQFLLFREAYDLDKRIKKLV